MCLRSSLVRQSGGGGRRHPRYERPLRVHALWSCPYQRSLTARPGPVTTPPRSLVRQGAAIMPGPAGCLALHPPGIGATNKVTGWRPSRIMPAGPPRGTSDALCRRRACPSTPGRPAERGPGLGIAAKEGEAGVDQTGDTGHHMEKRRPRSGAACTRRRPPGRRARRRRPRSRRSRRGPRLRPMAARLCRMHLVWVMAHGSG